MPVVDARECPLDKEAVDSFVRACESNNFYYLFRIDGHPTLYALLGSQTPMLPVTDHFTKALARSEARLAKKGAIKP